MRYMGPGRYVVIILAACLAVAPASAPAATVTQTPTVSGDPTPGSELTATAGDWTPASATATYDWLRCSALGDDCTPVAGSCDRRYTVRDADLGHRLRVRLTASEPGQPDAFGASEPTDIVITKTYSIPTAGDSGATCVQVTSTGPGAGTFTSGGSSGPGTTPSPTTSLAFIDPFPVVRISGRFTRKRTKFTRVSVRAPRGARIRVRCVGRSCPYKRRAIAVRYLRIRKLQRSYRPGVSVEIRVTQARKIGKYTRVRTRRGKAPTRIDRCLMPDDSTEPVRCPKG
jgi:hypothetical protein